MTMPACTGDCNQGRRMCAHPQLCSQAAPWPVKGEPKMTPEQERLMSDLGMMEDVVRGLVTGVIVGLLVVVIIAMVSA